MSRRVIMERNGKELSAIIETGNGIEVSFLGYGTKDTAGGPVVYIEVGDDGHPVVYVWADKDSEEPTHKINLGGAKE